MNKIISLSFIMVFSGFSYGNEVVNEVESKKISKDLTVESKRSLELSAGLYQMNNSFDSGGSEELQGKTISVGKEFIMPNTFKTKSILKYSWADNERRENKSTTDSSFSDVEFNQSFSYPFIKNEMVIRPYVLLGYGIGNYEQETSNLDKESKEDLGISSLKTKASYTIRSIGAGVQVKLINNLAPYLEFKSSTIAFDNVSTSIDESGSKTKVSVDSKLSEITSNTLTLGLSYFF